jgi:hypothetical protein
MLVPRTNVSETPLFRAFAAQRGLFQRIAKRLNLDPSYISRVAHGQRKNKQVSLAIETELNKIQAALVTVSKHPIKKAVRKHT